MNENLPAEVEPQISGQTNGSNVLGTRKLHIMAAVLVIATVVIFINYQQQTNAAGNGKIVLPKTDATNNQQLFSINPDGTGMVQLTFNPATSTASSSNAWPSFSPNGAYIAYTCVNSYIPGGTPVPANVCIMNANGSGQHQIKSRAYGPDWHPAGDIIAYSSDTSGNEEIWTMDTNGNNATRLTNGPTEYKNTAPSWSPDGTKMVYARINDNSTTTKVSVWMMNADGSNKHELTVASSSGNWYNYLSNGQIGTTANDANAPSWGPTGVITFWAGIRMSYGQIWKINSDGSGRQQLTFNAADTYNDEPSWSPDSNWILYSSSVSGVFAKWKMSTNGTNQSAITPVTSGPLPAFASWQPVP